MPFFVIDCIHTEDLPLHSSAVQFNQCIWYVIIWARNIEKRNGNTATSEVQTVSRNIMITPNLSSVISWAIKHPLMKTPPLPCRKWPKQGMTYIRAFPCAIFGMQGQPYGVNWVQEYCFQLVCHSIRNWRSLISQRLFTTYECVMACSDSPDNDLITGKCITAWNLYGKNRIIKGPFKSLATMLQWQHACISIPRNSC